MCGSLDTLQWYSGAGWGAANPHWALLPCFQAAPATQMELIKSRSPQLSAVSDSISVIQKWFSPLPQNTREYVPTEGSEGKCGGTGR